MTTNVDEPAEAAPPPAPPRARATARGCPGSSTPASLEASLLPIAFVLVIVGFGIARPDTFFQWSNFTSIFGLNATALVLVDGAADPAHQRRPGPIGRRALRDDRGPRRLAERQPRLGDRPGDPRRHSPWASLCGAITGSIIVKFDVNPFIITLAMGSVFDGIAFWLPNQETVPGISPQLADWTVLHHILGIPLDFWYGIVIMLIMFYVLTFTAFGQRSLFVGQSREVARLSGFKVGLDALLGVRDRGPHRRRSPA